MNDISNVEKIELNGYPIHYEKFGSGSEVVLLIPGSLGKWNLIQFLNWISSGLPYKERQGLTSISNWKDPTLLIWKNIRL